MHVLLFGAVDWRHYMFMIPLTLLSLFLILVILVQRGRGGGLTGALGGMGGQSAFGTKAGDLFTRITIIVAAIWVLLSMASLKVLNQYASTGNLDPSARGKPTAPAGESLPSATTSTTKAGTKAEAEQPPASSTKAPADKAAPPPPPSPPTSAPSSSPPATGDAGAKTPDAAKN